MKRMIAMGPMAGGLVAGALMAGGLSASATWAQQGASMPPHQAEAQLADYADCVVSHKRFRVPVEQFLRTVPDSDGFFPASMKAADMTCLNAAATRAHSKIEMRMQPASFRAALYPALYRRDYGITGPVAGIAALPPMRFAADFDGDVAALPPTYLPARAFGDCIARRAPQQVHALLIARPYDKREDAAVEQLKPAMANCLSEGETVRVTRPTLRGSAGEAMYKLSRVAAAAAPAG
ncbi:hypothetical protein SAMN05192583_1544 [Sphingomonas gellani]|uniref:Uncharacterized protein n=1 Tax=Sphingomonas gellani TaxID=1166340 RepID=A0A1H8CC65_9SPHN|nr:hypothetical protein [Sphingomonas gellani]SEM92552.1 hypothetical protein SAMN05192583_1544 [Sphingomonas gellani]